MINQDFNDILITPAVTSTIRSRSEINPYQTFGSTTWLPVMVSPMDTVISKDNWQLFIDQKMPICFPRGIRPNDFEGDELSVLDCFKDVIFFSYSLDETSEMLEWLIEAQSHNPSTDLGYNILIDIANGHMQHMVDLVKDLKRKSKVKIMVGNIANPETYRVLSEAGADLIRVGIGFGGGCFEENTLIRTESGEKRIVDVNDGDYVMTHDGTYQEVIGKSIMGSKAENMIYVNGKLCTKCHEIYVVKKKDIHKLMDDNISDYAFYIRSDKLSDEYMIVCNV